MISVEPLSLVHPEIIEEGVQAKKVPLDVFSSDEVLKELLGAYSSLLPFHHKR